MEKNFKRELEIILKKDERLINDKGELNINLIHQHVNNLDEHLLNLLLSEEKTKVSLYKKGLSLTEKLVPKNPLLFLYYTVMCNYKKR